MEANTLAYYNMATVEAVKSFTAQTPKTLFLFFCKNIDVKTVME
jgi:hypothetical protein